MSFVKYVLLWFLFIPIATFQSFLHGGECSACIFLDDCPAVLEILQLYEYPRDRDFFESVSCGYFGQYPLVCCDRDFIRELLIAQATVDQIGYVDGPALDGERNHDNDDQRAVEFTLSLLHSTPDALNQRMESNSESNKSVVKVNDAVCGSNTEYRIIGGQPASTGMFPWMARLGYRVRDGGVNSSVVKYRCGGALVTARHVLTAAHCLRRLPAQTYLATVRLGADGGGGKRGTPRTFAPELTLAHPQFDRPRMHNDIGLVKLNRDAVFSDTIMPICLPFGGFSLELERLPPRAMLVAGWGSTNADSISLSQTLRYTRLTHQPREDCARIYASRFSVTLGPNQICTFGEKDQDSCGGDSGGPLFVWDGAGGGARAVGLVSFGARRCGTQGVPTVYTKIDAYQQWIEESVAN